MKFILLIFFYSIILVVSKAQVSIDLQKENYKKAYLEILAMLEDRESYNFKRAVFVTENAFYDNSLDYSDFNDKISSLTQLCSDFINVNKDNFIYDYEDNETVIKYASVFKLMTGTLLLANVGDYTIKTIPYQYDFDDMWGKNDWSKMFVSKLLTTHNGNCHSLPFLYKIILEELGADAHLALAPNHVYIKHYSKKTGMYNTELTSGAFPVDAWLMASGYIHLDAVRNGIYMDTLSQKQSLSLCLLDLAKGYERKFGQDDDFISECCETALKYYPNFINGLLTKSEILKRRWQRTEEVTEKKAVFQELENMVLYIHKLGYRKMPEKMYMDWLLELKENKEKYENTKVSNSFTKVNTN